MSPVDIIDINEVVAKARWMLERDGALEFGFPTVWYPADLWPICPPENWMGIRWKAWTEAYLTISLGSVGDTWLHGRWWGYDVFG